MSQRLLPSWNVFRRAAIGLTLLACGCITASPTNSRLPPERPLRVNADELYTLACPDEIEVVFDGRSDMNCTSPIGPDGCVEIGELGRIRVEGDTCTEAAQRIAASARMPFAQVRIRVAEFNSRKLFIYGSNGSARAVPYQGPETVMGVLRRSGGLGKEPPNEAYIVRSQLSEAKPTEVLAVDLQAIRDKNDHRTDYRLQPQDEIYVGAKPGSSVAKAMPPILKPAYETIRALFAKKD